MRQILLIILFVGVINFQSNAQDSVFVNTKQMSMTMDSTKMCCKNCYCNIISFGGKYYFNTLGNTRTTLANNGFQMDQEAFEYQLRLYNLPKIFYFQQLGNLVDENYASVTGFGIKEDLRWNIFKNSNFILAPYVEAGAGYYRMNIVKGVNSNSISSVLNSNIENYFMDNFVITGDIGLDLGFGFTFENKRFNIIFNGGYITNYPSEWRLAGSLAFKEKINLASPYAGVTLRLEMNCDKSCNDAKCN